MPHPEHGPNPQELAEHGLENLMTTYFSFDEAGVPASSLELVITAGQKKVLRPESASPDPVAVPERLNNFDNLFRPNTHESCNRLLEQLGELGQPGAGAEAVIANYGHKETALYFLAKRGYLRQAFEKLGHQKAARFMSLTAELAQPIDYLNPETFKKLSHPDYLAKQAEQQALAKDIYVILRDLKIDVAALDV